MADDFALSDIKKIAGGEELLAGNFGIEVEGLASSIYFWKQAYKPLYYNRFFRKPGGNHHSYF